MSDWTPEEKRWLSRAKRLFREKPEGVCLYTADGEITACRLGVPSTVVCEDLSQGGTVMACCYTSDHEHVFEMGHGWKGRQP